MSMRSSCRRATAGFDIPWLGEPRSPRRGMRARIERGSWPEPPVFDWLRRIGPIEEAEMDRTFNRGLGLILAVPPRDADRVIAKFRRSGEKPYVIGEIVRGEPGVEYA